MSAAPELVRERAAIASPPPAPAAPPQVPAPVRARRAVQEGLDRIAWEVTRTGRPGLAGIALLVASGLFLATTHLPIADSVRALRADLEAMKQRPDRQVREETAPAPGGRGKLPGRSEMPTLLRQLFARAGEAGLVVDTGKYEVVSTPGSEIVRHHVLLPVTGRYGSLRDFVGGTLGTMPAVAVRDLALERKTILDGGVQARIRFTVYTLPGDPPARPGPAPAEAPSAAAATGGEDEATEADGSAGEARRAGLFAMHSWHVVKVVPLPPPPSPPPPTAPPFPYAFLGSYAPNGATPVYFLSQGDRVVEARVGDQLNGVYQLDSADAAQLVFTYLPLGERQVLATGGPR